MKSKIFTMLVLAVFVISSLSMGAVQAQEAEIVAVQDINLLAPNTNPARNQWSQLMSQELEKIGFHVEYENVGWDIIAPRTFSWEPDSDTAPNVIPIAKDGGYDLLFVGLSGSIAYDPTYSYAGSQFSAAGDNFAHYNNSKVNELCDKYASELSPAVRETYAKEIQTIVADEVPYIPLMNTHGLWAYDASLKSNYSEADWLLISTSDTGDGWKNHIAAGGKDTLVYAHTYELQEFTSFVVSSYIAAQYLAPVQVGLFERDPNDPIYARKPLIAAEMPVWNDAKTVANVTLRQDVTFSNGHKLNATDIVNTYQMTLTPKVGATSYSSVKKFLKNTDGNGNKVDVNNSIIAKSEYEVTFLFEKPYFDADSIMNLALYDHQVIGTPDKPLGPKDNPYDFNANGTKYSIGAGPFILEKYDTTAHNVRLKARDDYWNGSAILKTMEFNKYGDKAAALADLKGKKVDIIDAQAYLDIAEVEGVAGVEYLTFADFGTQMMAINMDHPIFGTGVDTPLGKEDPTKAAEAAKYVRLAISHATPRQFMVDEIVKGLGSASTSLWPDNAEGFNDALKVHEYNIVTAKEYMVKAGYEIKTAVGFLPIDMTAVFMGILSIGIVSILIRKRRN